MYTVSVAYPAKTDRESILAVALQQVESEGVENLAIRSVASKLGLAPNALYRYFENLAALEAALAEEVRFQMLLVMQKSAGRKGPAETIRAISGAYLSFAHERPRLFALFLKTSGHRSQQCERNTEFFLEQVSRVHGKERARQAAMTLWALLQGLAALREAGVLDAKDLASNLKFGLGMWIDSATTLLRER